MMPEDVLRILDLQWPSRLRGVTASFQSGRVYGILGPNGSGKTTFLQTVAGLLGTGFGGKIECLGADMRHSNALEWARRVTYVGPELSCEFPLKVWNYVDLGGYRFGPSRTRAEREAAVSGALERCGVRDLVHRDVRSLSGGEGQKVQLARALVQEPKVLILDEALGKIDIDQRPRVIALMKEVARAGQCVLWVSHEPGVLESGADEILLFREGECRASLPTREALKPENLRRAYPNL